MNKYLKFLLCWLPRILCILFVIFMNPFAIRFKLINLISPVIILVLLLISWRWELQAGLIFITLGALYFYNSLSEFHMWNFYILFYGPLFLIGILFITDAILEDRL